MNAEIIGFVITMFLLGVIIGFKYHIYLVRNHSNKLRRVFIKMFITDLNQIKNWKKRGEYCISKEEFIDKTINGYERRLQHIKPTGTIIRKGSEWNGVGRRK